MIAFEDVAQIAVEAIQDNKEQLFDEPGKLENIFNQYFYSHSQKWKHFAET